ncbi:MAG: DUF2029 domain-containing protein [Gammaproteobacteria bacterium]|nr:DUF2029 domain-containing protein [Gammaproteobacteria bacterium]
MNGFISLTDRVPTRLGIDLVGVCCALAYATLAYLAQHAGEPSLLAFYAIVFWSATPVFCLYLLLTRRDEPLPISRLFFWALVFRVCGLVGGPFYEDDFFRYLWDGYRFWEAGTPYGIAPEAFFLNQSVPVQLQAVLNQINHPDVATIYGPITQLLFLVAFLLNAASVATLQGLLIVVDLATIYFLTRLTSTRNVMLYAWCPLVIKEIAFTAHPDGYAVCFVMAALLLTTKHRLGLAAFCLGLAIGAKIFALALVPFVLCRARFHHWLVFAGTVGLLYAPFVLTGATDIPTLMLFADEWEFNASLYALLTLAISATPAKLLLACTLAGGAIWYFKTYRREKTYIPRGDWIYGALFLAAPVFNAWYMLWLLPFAAIYPSRWAWTASIALLLTYITGLSLNDFDMQAYAQPMWVRLLEFGLIAIALAWDVRRNLRTKPLSH